MGAIEEVKTQVSEATKNVSFEVNTPADYEKAAEALKQTRKLLRFIDDREKDLTRPLNEGLKKARALFKPWKQKVNEVIAVLNANLSKFRRIQAEEAAEKQRKLDEETKPDDLFKPVAEVEIPPVEGVKIRTNWKYEVVDVNKINPQFMQPNDKMIREIVSKMKEKAPSIVGGIRVFTKETTY